jgi:hypothetical protein
MRMKQVGVSLLLAVGLFGISGCVWSQRGDLLSAPSGVPRTWIL